MSFFKDQVKESKSYAELEFESKTPILMKIIDIKTINAASGDTYFKVVHSVLDGEHAGKSYGLFIAPLATDYNTKAPCLSKPFKKVLNAILLKDIEEAVEEAEAKHGDDTEFLMDVAVSAFDQNKSKAIGKTVQIVFGPVSVYNKKDGSEGRKQPVFGYVDKSEKEEAKVLAPESLEF